MAKAGEEFRGGASLEDELSCPICLSLYRNPMLLSCGHSFCKQCIQKTLGAQQQSKAPYSCPVCKLQLGPILELQKNFQLCSIVETYLATASKGQQDEGSAEGKQEEVVPCDYCLDWSHQPAVKTCLNCDASLCQVHVNKHNAKASQQDHVLVAVGTGGGAARGRCPEHGRLLECFCQNEGQHICVLCAIAGRHKGHSIVTLKETHDKQLDELSATVTRLQEHESALTTALQELQKSEKQLKTNTNAVTSQLQELFEEMKTAMIQKEKDILSDIESNEQKQLADFTEVQKKMEERRDEVVKHLQALQKMREEPDIFLFFEEFKLAKDRIASQDFSVDTMDVVEMQQTQVWMQQFQQQMRNFMSQLDMLLQDVKGGLTNQIRRSSGASHTGTPSNSSQASPSSGFLPRYPTGHTPPGFGTSTSSTFGTSTSSRFGAGVPSGFGTSTSSPFGASMPSGFGTSTSSPFGAGMPSGFGTSTSSPFGASMPSGFGTSTSSPFGAGVPSGFGASTPCFVSGNHSSRSKGKNVGTEAKGESFKY